MVSQECKIKEKTTDVANMPMFGSDNEKFLDGTNMFDGPNIVRQQRF